MGHLILEKKGLKSRYAALWQVSGTCIDGKATQTPAFALCNKVVRIRCANANGQTLGARLAIMVLRKVMRNLAISVDRPLMAMPALGRHRTTN